MCERGRERERQGHITAESAVLIVACVQTHTSLITVSVTRLCSPLVLELMVKLRTLLTVFIFTLKVEARDYGKGRYISDMCLRCSANHTALGQLTNQSRLCLSEEGALFLRGSVVEHCVSSAKGCGFDSQGIHLLGIDRYVFFRADADTDYYRSSRPITDILNRYTCLV